MNPRERLAARQAELLRALLAGGDPPPGFDPRRLESEAVALRAKRRRVMAYLRPDLAAALGERFGRLFDSYAVANPRIVDTRAREDAELFVDWLVQQGEWVRPRKRQPLRRFRSR